MMQAESHGPSMIFCRTKRRAQAVADELTERGLRRGRRPRRPRSGRPRAGPARVPQRQGRHPGGHRRGGPRHRRRGRHARHQLRVPRRREDLPAPRRPHRPGRRLGRRDHVRRLGGRAALGADQQGARAVVPRPDRDLPHLRAPVHRARDPRRAPTGRLPRRSQTHAGLEAEVLEDLGGRQPSARDRDGRRAGPAGTAAGTATTTARRSRTATRTRAAGQHEDGAGRKDHADRRRPPRRAPAQAPQRRDRRLERRSLGMPATAHRQAPAQPHPAAHARGQAQAPTRAQGTPASQQLASAERRPGADPAGGRRTAAPIAGRGRAVRADFATVRAGALRARARFDRAGARSLRRTAQRASDRSARVPRSARR